MKALEGKVAIITGGNGGLGMVLGRYFIANGAAVVLTDINADRMAPQVEEWTAQGHRALAITANITSSADCDRIANVTAETFGQIDILVNNAGVDDGLCPVTRCTDAMWHKNIAVNQTGVFYLSRAVLRHMVPRSSGNIINISSIGGYYGLAGISYSAAKRAVIGLTKNIAIQYVGKGIRCNAVCPGPVATGMNGQDAPPCDMAMLEQVERRVDTTVPMITPESVADVVIFFASDASRSVNGQALVIDQGTCL